MAYELDEKPDRKPPIDVTLRKLYAYAEMDNIAESLDETTLDKIAARAKDDYEIDKQSRAEWETSAEKAMEIALQVRQPKNYPFEGASNVKYPLVTVAALQFGARAYPAIVDGQRIVKGIPLGEDQGVPQMDETGQPVVAPETGEPAWQIPPGFKQEKADRISQHMSYQLLYEMEEWEEDTDVLLHHLPIVGCAFRKVWRDGRLGRNRVVMRPALKVVVNNSCECMEDAPRVTDELEIYPHEIEERKRAGEFLDIDLPIPTSEKSDGNDKDAAHEILEQHRYIDLDKDGYREPYIVTLHKETNKVLRIVANYRTDDIEHDGSRIIRIPRRDYFVKYAFLRDPEGGFYDIGFGKLLESLSASIDTSINQMLDAASLQNAGGGFIGSGLRFKKSQIRFNPGKYQTVETSGGNIRDSIYHMEHNGPSQTSFALLELLLNAASDITSVKDIMTGDTGEKVQTATTTLAQVEQGLKVFTAIYKRIWTSMRKEFKLLFELNAEYMDEQEYFTFLDVNTQVSKQDYDSSEMDVVPVADPKMVTDMQRAARAQFLIELFPFIPNKGEALRRVLESANIDNIDELMKAEGEGGPSPEELAAEAENAKAQMEAETKMAIEQMKAQSTAELQTLLEGMRSEVEMEKIDVERQDLALKERIQAAEDELKRRELEQEAELRREEIKSRNKSEPRAVNSY